MKSTHILSVLIAFICLELHAQQNEAVLPDFNSFPKTGQWFNCDTAKNVNALTRRNFVLLTFWNSLDPEISSFSDSLAYLGSRHNYLNNIGVHIPIRSDEKDSALVGTKARQLGMEYAQFNDSAKHFSLTHEDLPLIVLLGPENTEEVLWKGDSPVAAPYPFDHVDKLMSAIASEYNKPGKTLFPSYAPALPISKSEYSLLKNPSNIEIDEVKGLLYIADSGNDRILICTLEGEILSSIGTGEPGNNDGSFRLSSFNDPRGMALDGPENLLYVADAGNNCIRLIDLDKRTVSTIFGNGQRSWDSARNLIADEALNRPMNVQLDGYTLLVTMAGGHRFHRLNLESLEARAMVGSGESGGEISKKALDCQLREPASIVIDEYNRPIFIDKTKESVYLIDKRKVKTLPLFKEGPEARPSTPVPVELKMEQGRLHLLDSRNKEILKWNDLDEEPSKIEISNKNLLKEPVDMVFYNDAIYLCDAGRSHILKLEDGILTGIKLTKGERVVVPSRKMGKMNMAETLIIPESGQSALSLKLSLPDEFLMNYDEESLFFLGQGKGMYSDNTSLIDGSIELQLISEELRYQLTLVGELYFCEVEDPSKCYRKDLNVIVPIEKSAEAPIKQEREIRLLPELN